MTTFVPGEWSELLRLTAGTTLRQSHATGPLRRDPAAARAYIDSFADEQGHRRAVDRPLLAWVLRIDPGAMPAVSADVELWWRLHRVTGDPAGLVQDLTSLRPQPLLSPSPTGPIEVWTEAELCAMHALWRLGMGSARREWVARARAAAKWHVDNIQPDNATNHPWGIHVFLGLAAMEPQGGAMLYAQTLLHNCQLGLGRPDLMSAWILFDAAEAIDEWSRRDWGVRPARSA